MASQGCPATPRPRGTRAGWPGPERVPSAFGVLIQMALHFSFRTPPVPRRARRATGFCTLALHPAA